MANNYQRPKRTIRVARRGSAGAEAASRARGSLADISREILAGRMREGIDADIDALQVIIGGGPAARNAQSRIKAIQLKWGYGFGLPQGRMEHETGPTLANLLEESMRRGGGKNRKTKPGNHT